MVLNVWCGVSALFSPGSEVVASAPQLMYVIVLAPFPVTHLFKVVLIPATVPQP